jgi:hypothetical protein
MITTGGWTPADQCHHVVMTLDDPADLHVVVQERHEFTPGVLPHPDIAGHWAPHLAVNSTKRSLAAA